MPAKKSRAEELTELFYKTPEMRECRETAGTVNNRLDSSDTARIRVNIPKAFIPMIELIERNHAADAGRSPRRVEQVLSQILVNELHGQLHWLTTGPAYFEHYRNLWNRFCDAHGAPEEKIPEPDVPKPAPRPWEARRTAGRGQGRRGEEHRAGKEEPCVEPRLAKEKKAPRR
jgi:hypothetical protein